MHRARTRLAAALGAAALGVALAPAAAAVPVAPDAGATLQPQLAEQLAAAAPDDVLPVAVWADSLAALDAAVATAGLRTVERLEKVTTTLATGTPAQIEAVRALPGVRHVEGDSAAELLLDTSHVATRGRQALDTFTDAEGTRIGGAGVGVAVIDSGVDGTHPFFEAGDGSSRVVVNLKNVCPFLNPTALASPDTCFQPVPGDDADTLSNGGHGTHVAGIVGGREVTVTGDTGEGEATLHGAAPDVEVTSLSVGQTISIFAGAQGLNWVLENHADPCGDGTCAPIKATNNSYGPGGGGEFDPDSVTVRIQRALVDEGVVTVWAAGNDGGDGSGADQSTNPPGQDPTPGILMVASYDDGGTGSRDGALSSFSSRGTRGSPGTYPDISAPGDTITSACRPQLAICNGAPTYDGLNYQTISGTSMAAPHIAGIVAQLFQADPSLTPAQVEDVLEDTAHRFGAPDSYEADDPARNDDHATSFDKGHGLVDVTAAVARVLAVSDPAPSTSAPVCGITSVQVLDASGDATEAVVTGETSLPSQPSLDVTKGFLTWDAAAQELTVHVRVTDLSAGPPDGAVGEFFRVGLGVGSAPAATVVLSRDTTTGTQRYSLRPASGDAVDLTGDFDEERSEVRAVLPADVAESALGVELVDGTVVVVPQVLAQRNTGTATLTADTAGGVCSFTVGTSMPTVADVDPGGETGEPEPVVPEAPLAVLLPVLAAALGGGVLAAGRRRERVTA